MLNLSPRPVALHLSKRLCMKESNYSFLHEPSMNPSFLLTIRDIYIARLQKAWLSDAVNWTDTRDAPIVSDAWSKIGCLGSTVNTYRSELVVAIAEVSLVEAIQTNLRKLRIKKRTKNRIYNHEQSLNSRNDGANTMMRKRSTT